MDDLLAEFTAETREMLEAIGGELVAWEANPADRCRLDTIFRFVHTVKGNCGFFDFPRLERLSHAAESVLADIRSDRREVDRALVDGVLAIIDRIGAIVAAIESEAPEPADDDAKLIAALAECGEATAPNSCDAMLPGRADTAASLSGNLAAYSGPALSMPRSIRLPVELMDRVMAGVSDMVLARNDLARRLKAEGRGGRVGEICGAPFDRLSSIIDDVREATTRMRMQRLEHLFGSLPRMVRDLSADLGKQVMVDICGADVELDREMIEMVRDPLTHIIRNAIDHGIETPSARLSHGKREIGLIEVAARQTGNRIIITVADDGRGIDGEALTRKALAAGIVTEEEAANLSEAEQLDLIFEPGITTAEKVSEISGRGVGMDVVRTNIEKIGGTVALESTRGEETRFMLELPLTLSIIPALTITAGGQNFALPRSGIAEIVAASRDDERFMQAGDALLATIRGQRIGCAHLADILGLSPDRAIEKCPLLVATLANGDRFALAVDRILDHEELVVKPVAPAIMATGLYAGTTLLDDGSPVMMLDLAGLSRRAGLAGQHTRRNRQLASDAEDIGQSADLGRAPPILVFEGLDGQRRAVRMDLVSRIEKSPASSVTRLQNGRCQIVIDGRVETLAGVGSAGLPQDTLVLLRLSDGAAAHLSYAVRRIIDSAALTGTLFPAGPGEEGIEGIALVDGLRTEIVDAFSLFAGEHARFPVTVQRPTCYLPDSDPWILAVLMPLVEQAGYRVTHDPEIEATVAFLDERTHPPSGAGKVIRLRSEAAQASGSAAENEIYRYDRPALMAALGKAGAAA